MNTGSPAVAPPIPGFSASSDSVPPFRLPGEHFAAALAFLLLGAAGLVRVAPDLAEGIFPLPSVVATAHLFTLGVITTSILGALYQFLPVALGTPIRSVRVAHLSFWLYVPGLALFLCGLLTPLHATAIPAGAALFSLGLLLFLGNLAATLARVERRDLTWWALAGAGFFLLATIALGLTLAGNIRWGYMGGEARLAAVGVHLHIAAAGWILLVIIGVAQHLLSMFLLSHGVPKWPARLAVGLIATGAMLLTVMDHSGLALPYALPAALIWAGTLSFLAQAALSFRRSMKPRLDPGMRLAGAGLGFLALALGLGPAAYAQGIAAPRLWVAYVTALVLGGFTLFVAAHLYKIIPFLVWFHRFGPLAGKQPVPAVSDLYDARLAGTAALLLAIGAAGLVAAILTGRPAAARFAAAVFASGTILEAGQLLAVSRRRPA